MVLHAMPIIACLLASQAYQVEEAALGRIGDPLDALVTSEDGLHVAYVTYSESDDVPARFGLVDLLWTVWVDGRRVAAHHREDHQVQGLRLSPRYAEPCYLLRYHSGRWRVVLNGHESHDYEAIGGSGPVFSPDGEACAYAALRGGAWRVVVQPRRGGPREEPSVEEIRAESLRIGPRGESVAYVAKRDGEWRAVLNGVAGVGFNEVRGDSLVLSATGERWAYAARRGASWTIVTDGLVGPEYDWVSAPAMDAHGEHVVYSAMLGEEGLLVRDGEVVGRAPCLAIDAPVFSRSAEGVAALCRREHSVCVLHGGSLEPDFRAVAGLSFGPAGNRPAYLAASRAVEGLGLDGCSEWRLVRDGESGPVHGSVDLGSLSWSADGTRVAHLARTEDGRWCCLTNGTPGPVFDEAAGPIVFAPKGGRMAFAVRQKSRWFMAGTSDGYDAVSNPAFGPDGEAVAYRALADGRWRVVLGDVRAPEYDEILSGPVRLPNGAFEFLAMRDRSVYRTRYVPK